VFLKHLPPSAGLPRVLVLDAQAAAELHGRADLTPDGPDAPLGPFDAVAGQAAPEHVTRLAARLRPGGRLILAASAAPAALLQALTAAGLIHCLVEPAGEWTLYRGERPPLGTPVERQAALAAGGPAPGGAAPDSTTPGSTPTGGTPTLTPPDGLRLPHIYVLITQTPNKPAWKLTPADQLEWRAATLVHPDAPAPAVLAFSGLARAVAFMQAAVLAGTIKDVNKVGKFAARAAQAWGRPLLINPDFARVRPLPPGPPLVVDPALAITGEE
jgi:hypothetical protein